MEYFGAKGREDAKRRDVTRRVILGLRRMKGSLRCRFREGMGMVYSL